MSFGVELAILNSSFGGCVSDSGIRYICMCYTAFMRFNGSNLASSLQLPSLIRIRQSPSYDSLSPNPTPPQSKSHMPKVRRSW